MARTATKKRKPKTGVEQYTAASPWKRRLIWLYYLGHLTKDGAKQGLSCKIKEEKGDPTTYYQPSYEVLRMLPHACVSKTQIVLKMSTNGRQVGVGFVTPSWFSDTDQHVGFGEEEKNKEFQFTSDHQIFISMVRIFLIYLSYCTFLTVSHFNFYYNLIRYNYRMKTWHPRLQRIQTEEPTGL